MRDVRATLHSNCMDYHRRATRLGFARFKDCPREIQSQKGGVNYLAKWKYGSFKLDGLTASQRYYRRHKIKRLIQSRKYRRAHLKENAARMRSYRKRNPEIIKAIENKRVRPESFTKKFNEYNKVWRKLNPDKVLASHQRRRANYSGSVSAIQIIRLRISQDWKCFYCLKPLDNKSRGHVEHKTPISRGGSNSTENICIACSSCNLKKGRKTENEFRINNRH